MSFHSIPAGKDLPNDIHVAIEIPANSTPVKYEIEPDHDALFVDRFMATPMFYPANYGYIPQTLSEDGDALDVLVVTPYPVVPGSIIRSRPVGMLRMSDEAGVDAKLLAVPHSKLTVLYDHVQEPEDLPKLLIQQIEHFFERYKDLEEGKWVKIDGWADADAPGPRFSRPPRPSAPARRAEAPPAIRAACGPWPWPRHRRRGSEPPPAPAAPPRWCGPAHPPARRCRRRSSPIGPHRWAPAAGPRRRSARPLQHGDGAAGPAAGRCPPE